MWNMFLKIFVFIWIRGNIYVEVEYFKLFIIINKYIDVF